MVKKLTGEEIINLLNESDISVSDWAYNGLSALDTSDAKEAEIYRKLGRVIQETQKGGEGQGDVWYVVYYFVDHGVYIRTDGFYSSYNGVEFYDGIGYEVKPQQKTITVYEGV